MVSSSLALAGICGTLFASYCVYFDRKRRSAPDYKKKLHERRNPKGPVKFPNLNKEIACYNFFMGELAKGLKCIDEGKIDEGCNTVANSLVVLGVEKRTHFLSIIENTRGEFYDTIVQRIPEAEDRLRKYQNRFTNVRLPDPSDNRAVQKFIHDQVELANTCMEDVDMEGVVQHYAHIVVFIEEEELSNLLAHLGQGFGKDFLKRIINAAGGVEQRKKARLLEADQRLALSFLLTIPLAYGIQHFYLV